MIKEGDTVIVWRPTACCGHPSQIGLIFTAGPVWPSPAYMFECKYCGVVRTYETMIVDGPGGGYATERLKRIDPPALNETTDTYEELTV